MNAFPVESILKLLPIQIAFFGAMIAFLNFLPRVYDLMKGDPEFLDPEKSFPVRARFKAVVESKQHFVKSLLLLGLSIFIELTYVIFSNWRLPVNPTWMKLNTLYNWAIVSYSCLGPILFAVSILPVYKWAKPWAEYFYHTLSQRRPGQ